MITEYLAWNDCNNNCKFCWQRLKAKSNTKQRLEAIKLIKEDMCNLNIPYEQNQILFVGGELFFEQDNDTKEALYDLFEYLFDLMYNEKVSRSYLNTNLLYNPEYLLFPVLDMALSKNLLDRLNFTTSGDETDRFVGIKGEEKRALFYENLKRLRNLYPEMNIMVNLILTKQFCDSVLNGKFDINEYEKKHGVIMNVIPYIKLKNDERTPSREEVFSTLIRLNSQQPGYLKRVCDNHTTHPIRKLLHYENGKLVNVSCDLNPCGHAMNFTRCYNNSESCFACDIKKLYTLMSTDLHEVYYKP